MTISPVSGGGNWSVNATWTGGVAPTATDDVDLSPLTGTLTVDGTSGSPNLCNNFTVGTSTGTLTHAGLKQLNVSGGWIMTAGFHYVPASSSLLKFTSASGVNNITSGGKTMRSVNYDGIGGSWKFLDSWTGVNIISNAEKGITLLNGALDTNGQTVNSTNFIVTGSGVCSLTMGTTTWTTSNQAGVNWDVSANPNFTLSAGSATVIANNSGGNSNVTFRGGGFTYAAVTINPQANSAHTITGTNTIGVLTTNGNASPDCSIQFNDPQTITTWNANGGNATNRLLVTTDSYVSPFTCHQVRLTVSVINASNIDFQNIDGGGMVLNSITGGSGDCGGNANITFTTPQICYYVTSNSANWSAARWATQSGGPVVTFPSRVPLPQDAAIFDSQSFAAGSLTVTIINTTFPRICSFDFTGAAVVGGLPIPSPSAVGNNPTLNISSCTFFGDMFFAPSALMTISGNSNPVVTIQAQNNNKILTSGQILPVNIVAQLCATTYTQLDDLNVSGITSNAFNISDDSIWDAAGFKITASGTGVATKITVQNTAQILNSGDFLISSTNAVLQILNSGLLDATNSTVTAAGGATLTGGTLLANDFVRTGLATTIAGTAVMLGSGGMTSSTLLVSSGALTTSTGPITLSSSFTITGGNVFIGTGGATYTSYDFKDTTGTITFACLPTIGPTSIVEICSSSGANACSAYC